MYIERCGGGPGDTVRLKVAGNEVTLYSGMQDNGQGHTTTFVQLLSQKLGIDAAKIKVVQGDTDLVPGDGLTGGSRFLAIARRRGGQRGGRGDREGQAKKRRGGWRPRRRTSSTAMASSALRARIGEWACSSWETWKPPTPARRSTTPTRTAATSAKWKSTRRPAAVTIVRYTVVDDFGRAMNPKLLEGQVQGGTVQGIGQALLEHAVYDADSGQLLSGSFMDYAMPRAGDMPSFDCGFHHVPCTTNPLGVKGAGEAGAVGAPAAVVNAVANALGVRHIDMPLTPEKVWRALTTS